MSIWSTLETGKTMYKFSYLFVIRVLGTHLHRCKAASYNMCKVIKNQFSVFVLAQKYNMCEDV